MHGNPDSPAEVSIGRRSLTPYPECYHTRGVRYLPLRTVIHLPYSRRSYSPTAGHRGTVIVTRTQPLPSHMRYLDVMGTHSTQFDGLGTSTIRYSCNGQLGTPRGDFPPQTQFHLITRAAYYVFQQRVAFLVTIRCTDRPYVASSTLESSNPADCCLLAKEVSEAESIVIRLTINSSVTQSCVVVSSAKLRAVCIGCLGHIFIVLLIPTLALQDHQWASRRRSSHKAGHSASHQEDRQPRHAECRS